MKIIKFIVNIKCSNLILLYPKLLAVLAFPICSKTSDLLILLLTPNLPSHKLMLVVQST